MSALIRLEGVTQVYGGRRVLSVDSLDLEPGSILGLAGSNGAGKSTLLRIMAFLEKPVSGRLLFQGKAVEDRTMVRRKVTLLQQTPYLLSRSVYENLAYGLKVRGRTKDLRQQATEALDKVGLPPSFLKRRGRELSGGEAQRVSLAARLMLSPQALLLDEPTASLDEESRQAIMDAALAARREQGTALCIVSHDRDWLDEVADRVLTLHAGLVAGQGRVNVLTSWIHDQGRSLLRLPDGRSLAISEPEGRTCPDTERTVALLNADQVRPLAEGQAPKPGEAVLRLRLDRTALTAGGGLFARFSGPGISLWAHVPDHALLPEPGREAAVAVDTKSITWAHPAC